MATFLWIFLTAISLVWILDAVYHGLSKTVFFKTRFPSRPLSEDLHAVNTDRDTDKRILSVSRGRFFHIQKAARMAFIRYNKGVLDFYEQSLATGKSSDSKRNSKDKRPRSFAPGLGIVKLFWIFILANVLGSLIETIWCFATKGFFEMRTSMVYGLFIPIYGVGATMMAICLCRFYRMRSFWLFLGGSVIGGVVEYSSSVFQEVFFGTRSWDYSGTPFNLNGRTNMMFALIWGFLGVIWVKILYPLFSKWIEKIPSKAGIFLTIGLFTFLLLDAIMTIAALNRQIERQQGIPSVNVFERYLDEHLDDDYLYWVYPNMRYIE